MQEILPPIRASFYNLSTLSNIGKFLLPFFQNCSRFQKSVTLFYFLRTLHRLHLCTDLSNMDFSNMDPATANVIQKIIKDALEKRLTAKQEQTRIVNERIRQLQMQNSELQRQLQLEYVRLGGDEDKLRRSASVASSCSSASTPSSISLADIGTPIKNHLPRYDSSSSISSHAASGSTYSSSDTITPPPSPCPTK